MIDGHTGKTEILKPAKIRGVASNGMCCSEKELGISENHEGIIHYAAETSIGTSLMELMGDAIFNLEVTPNRPDCLAMTGSGTGNCGDYRFYFPSTGRGLCRK